MVASAIAEVTNLNQDLTLRNGSIGAKIHPGSEVDILAFGREKMKGMRVNSASRCKA